MSVRIAMRPKSAVRPSGRAHPGRAVLWALAALSGLCAGAAGAQVWRESFDGDAPAEWELVASPGVRARGEVLAGGSDGTYCLWVEARMLDASEPNAHVRLTVRVRGPEGRAVAVDSSTVLRWEWRVSDTHASDGIRVNIYPSCHSLGSSHCIYGAEGRDFGTRENIWQAVRVHLLELLAEDRLRSGERPPAAEVDELRFTINFPRDQQVWIDNLALGPDSVIPPSDLERWQAARPAPPEVSEQPVYPFSGALGDIDRDGDLDLFLVAPAPHGPWLLRNEGQRELREASDALGLAGVHGGGATLADLDGDGWLDLIVAVGPGQGLRILRNRLGLRFTPVAGVWDTLQMPCEPYGSAVADVDGDGDLDLAVAGVHGSACGPGGIALLRNDRGFHFTDVSRSLWDAIGGSRPNCFGARWGDFDGDGDPDLLCVHTGWEPPQGEWLYGAQLLENRGGDWAWHLLPTEFCFETEGCPCADFDRDGDLDAYVCVDRSQLPERLRSLRVRAANFLLENRGANRFVQRGRAAGVADEGRSEGAVVADLDSDGWPDIFVANALGENHAYQNRGDWRFADSTSAWSLCGTKYVDCALGGDLDGDGAIDLVLVDHEGGYRIRWNAIRQGHWLKVSLRGGGRNTQAIGAKVWMYTAGHLGEAPFLLSYREVQIGDGFSGSNAADLHFGLGATTRADLRVRFPSGSVRELRGVEAQQSLWLTEAPHGWQAKILHPLWFRLRPRARSFLARQPGVARAGLALALALACAAVSLPLRIGRWRSAVAAVPAGLVSFLLTPHPEIAGALLLAPAATVGAGLAGGLVGGGWHPFGAGRVHPVRLALLRELRACAHGAWLENAVRLQRLAELAGRADLTVEERDRVQSWLAEARRVYRGSSGVQVREIARLADRSRLGWGGGRALRRAVGRLSAAVEALGTGEGCGESAGAAGGPLAPSLRELRQALDAIGGFLAAELACDPRAAMIEVRDSLAASLAREGVTLEVRGAPDSEGCWSWIRHGELVNALTELVRNAARACQGRPRRYVFLRLATHGRRCSLTVSDTGCGVPPEIRERLFEEGITRSPEGTGFGLPYVQRLLRPYGATVELLGPESGCTTTLRVRLVRARPPTAGGGER